MLKPWLKEQQPHSFWLVCAQTHEQALMSNGFAFEGAVPLFWGNTFKDVMTLSPWLIPVSDEVLALDDSLLNLGLGIVTTSSAITIQHLRSMLMSILDGEAVLFRFYDKVVIGPMLRAMMPSELQQFLGNIDCLAFVDDELITFARNPQSDFQLKKERWWKLQPHHLESIYNTRHHAISLEKRCWQLIPDILEQLDEPLQIIASALERGIELGYPISELEACAIVELVQQSNSDFSQLLEPFRLTEQELSLLKSIKEIWV